MLEGILYSLSQNWIVLTILMPLYASLVKTSLSNKWLCWKIYKNRLFNVGDIAVLTNRGNGDDVEVEIIKYQYKLFSDVDQIVEIEYPDGDREIFYLLDWHKMRKKKPRGGQTVELPVIERWG